MAKITRLGGPSGVPQSLLDDTAAPSSVAEGPPGFDPAGHKVDEVVAYMAENPDQAAAVRAAEAAGKARKTILEA